MYVRSPRAWLSVLSVRSVDQETEVESIRDPSKPDTYRIGLFVPRASFGVPPLKVHAFAGLYR